MSDPPAPDPEMEPAAEPVAPAMPNSIWAGSPQWIMAQTLYGEARGEGQPGIEAVACVVMNRANNARWWGGSVVEVCQKPWQFSCWNHDDPNLPKLLAVNEDDRVFQVCLAVAKVAIAGRLRDMTGNADSYFDTSIPRPSWAHGKEPVYSVGDLRFYRLELSAPPSPIA